MLNFYKIVKENLKFNRFEFKDTVCLEYTCPIDAEQIGIFSKNDYLVYVLSGKKTYKTIHGEWTIEPGQALYVKKGAEIIHQFFDDEYCMLGFFLSDDLIRETYLEISGKSTLETDGKSTAFTALRVRSSDFLEGFFHSMLNYFRGINRPPDQIMVLKLKELLITLMDCDPQLTAYFRNLAGLDRPSLEEIVEKNFCYNLKLEELAELSHRSLSTFKREFIQHYHQSPGKWLSERRVKYAANLIRNSDLNITQVAFESGFEDLSHFSRVFKKIMGTNPTEYKKSLTIS